MTLAHLSDDDLVALADASLAEDQAADARAHLEGCAACAARADAHQRLQRALRTLAPPADSARAHAVARTALAASTPTLGQQLARWSQSMTGRFAFAGAAACAVTVLVVGVPASDEAPGDVFTARGDQREQPSAELQLFAVDGASATPSPLTDHAVLAGRGAALAVRVSLLPASEASAVAVFAQDATGRVTWLAPTWEGSQEAPACLAVDRLPVVIAPGLAVTLPAAVGPLKTGLVIARGAACTLPPLDAHLESKTPLPPGVSIVPGPTLQLR